MNRKFAVLIIASGISLAAGTARADQSTPIIFICPAGASTVSLPGSPANRLKVHCGVGATITTYGCPPGYTAQSPDINSPPIAHLSCVKTSTSETDAKCDPSLAGARYVVDATGLPSSARRGSDACFDSKNVPHLPKCDSPGKLISAPGHDKCRTTSESYTAPVKQ